MHFTPRSLQSAYRANRLHFFFGVGKQVYAEACSTGSSRWTSTGFSHDGSVGRRGRWACNTRASSATSNLYTLSFLECSSGETSYETPIDPCLASPRLEVPTVTSERFVPFLGLIHMNSKLRCVGIRLSCLSERRFSQVLFKQRRVVKAWQQAKEAGRDQLIPRLG